MPLGLVGTVGGAPTNPPTNPPFVGEVGAEGLARPPLLRGVGVANNVVGVGIDGVGIDGVATVSPLVRISFGARGARIVVERERGPTAPTPFSFGKSPTALEVEAKRFNCGGAVATAPRVGDDVWGTTVSNSILSWSSSFFTATELRYVSRSVPPMDRSSVVVCLLPPWGDTVS